MKLADLKIKLFQDCADLGTMISAAKSGLVSGFTTNPTLMRRSGVVDYEDFARKALEQIRDLPISFEVFSDDFASMEREARKIASWGQNVYVKIPVSNTKGETAVDLIRQLSSEGIALNITAIFTVQQVKAVAAAFNPGSNAIVSVFAGRIADAGIDPVPTMREAVAKLAELPKAELLWASTREALNIVQADACGCHIVTVPPDILSKLSLFGKDLNKYSLETVKMFYDDARAAGYALI